ncbi:MAG: hypothetical protein AAGA68_06685 [Pseudomonadota bacterium]
MVISGGFTLGHTGEELTPPGAHLLKAIGAWLAAGVLCGALVLLVLASRPTSNAAGADAAQVPAVRRIAVEYADLLTNLDPYQLTADASARGDRSLAELNTAIDALADANDPQAQALVLAGRDALTAGGALVDHRARLSNQVAWLQGQGPQVVRQLREGGNSLTAERAFSLLTRAVDAARRGGGTDQTSLSDDAELLRADTVDLPYLTPLLDAVESVAADRPLADASLAQLEALSVPRLARQAEASLLRGSTNLGAAQGWAALSAFSALSLIALLLVGLRKPEEPAPAVVADPTQVDPDLEAQTAVQLRLAEQLSTLDDAIADLELAQRGLAQRRHADRLEQVAAQIDSKMNTPLWYLRSNTTLVDERLDELQGFVDQTAQTLALFSGEQTDRQRVADGLTALRRSLRENNLTDSVVEVRGLLQDNADGLDDLTRDVGSIMSGLQHTDQSPAPDLAALVAQVAGQWAADRADAPVTVALDGPIIVDASQEPLQRGLLRAFTALAPKDASSGGQSIMASAHRDGQRVHLMLAAAQSTSDSGASAGLDLAIASKLIAGAGGQLQGGEASADSTITITLPVLLAQQEPEAAILSSASASASASDSDSEQATAS